VLANKKQYYQEHKEQQLEKERQKYPLKCDMCNEIRFITKCNINRAKRTGVNTCKKCQAPINGCKK
jgi:predicted SprT family Zn-dependent metalloprotease